MSGSVRLRNCGTSPTAASTSAAPTEPKRDLSSRRMGGGSAVSPGLETIEWESDLDGTAESKMRAPMLRRKALPGAPRATDCR